MSGTAFRARRSGRRRCPTPSRRFMSAPWASRRFRPRRCSPSSPDSRRSRRPRRSISARPTMFPPNSLPCWPVMRSWAESVSSKIRRRSPTGLSKGVRRWPGRSFRRASPQSGRVRSKGVPLWRRSRCLRPSHRSPTRRSAVVLRCRRSRWAM